MTISKRIILHNLSFQPSQSPLLFDRIHLTFFRQKYGIVGSNGVGKTALIKLILGELLPESGSIQINGHWVYVPQLHDSFAEQSSIANVLGVADIVRALKNIKQGSSDEADFDTVAEYWDIHHRIHESLAYFNLNDININRPFFQLSGGQKTKILLAKTRIFPTDFIIMDEPSNNLDAQTRQVLYDYVLQYEGGMIVVSHDRALLNLCNKIVEVTPLSVDCYSGNYDAYKEQKEIKEHALEHQWQHTKEVLQSSKKIMQSRMQRHEKNKSRGQKGKKSQIKAKGQYDKLESKAKKSRSENTNRRIRQQAKHKLDDIHDQLEQINSKRVTNKKLDVCLKATEVPNNKSVLIIDHLHFSYQPNKPILADVSFSLTGSARVVIKGNNGCGKTTLIKLIRHLLQPTQGRIEVGVNKVAYFDQSANTLQPNLSIVDAFLNLNPQANRYDAYCALAAFSFRNKRAEMLVADLSGGERIRAGLAVSLMSTQPPQLIILDEPTNHLDLNAISALEQALTLYQGALLVISHDEDFLDTIGINQTLHLG